MADSTNFKRKHEMAPLSTRSVASRPTSSLFPAMFSKFKKHIMGLAVLAVALVQVFGMRAGYVCGCTGQKSTEAKCETVSCHPDEAGTEMAETKDAKSNCGSESGKGQPQNDQDHQHKEVRENLVVAGLPAVLAPPMAVFFVLPPALQLPDFTALMASYSEIERSEPPEYGSPPMPQMVARVIVMMV